MNQKTKRTWAEINLSHLEHNYLALRGMLPQGCRFLGVVKANAYGHGAITVAKKLEELGADYLAVACLDEAIELRKAEIRLPILILGPTPSEYFGDLLKHDLTQTVHESGYAKELADTMEASGKPLKVHLKVDTGMSRLGFLCDEENIEIAVEQIIEICSMSALRCEGIFTHFSNADGDEEYTMLQLTRFLDVLNKLSLRGCNFEIRHCAASAAMLNYPCTHLDMVRGGIAMYGHYPDPSCQGLDGPGLLPLMALKTRVVSVRDLPAGSCISYGCTHKLTRDSRIAVIPVGYADGFDRLLSNRCEMLVKGVRVPLVGRVCMDMCMVDVTDVADVRVGEEVTVFGPDFPLEEKANTVGTIQYEMLCAVSPRVCRVYC